MPEADVAAAPQPVVQVELRVAVLQAIRQAAVERAAGPGLAHDVRRDAEREQVIQLAGDVEVGAADVEGRLADAVAVGVGHLRILRSGCSRGTACRRPARSACRPAACSRSAGVTCAMHARRHRQQGRREGPDDPLSSPSTGRYRGLVSGVFRASGRASADGKQCVNIRRLGVGGWDAASEAPRRPLPRPRHLSQDEWRHVDDPHASEGARETAGQRSPRGWRMTWTP